MTIDVAFISLRHILPALPPFLDAGADVVALVKPQFEAGRDEVGKRGLVTDPAVHDAVIARVTDAAAALRADARRDGAVARSPAPPATRNSFCTCTCTAVTASPIDVDQIIVLGAGAIGSVYAAKLAAQHPT